MPVLRLCGSLVFLGLTVGRLAPAAAQQRDSARADSAQRLPTIRVTSLRAVTSTFAAPLAVTRLDESAAFGTRGYSLDEAIGRIPGVFAQSRTGTSDIRIVIRGFGARGAGDRSNAGTSRGIRVLLDGIPETEPDGRTSFDGVDLAAVRSIEVIRSNATSLWGNAAGGVVSLSTLPSEARRGFEAEFTAGGFGLQRYVAHLSGGLGEGGIAGTVTRTVFDGWRQNSEAARWLASAALDTRVGDRTRLGVSLYATDNAFRIPGPLTQAQVDADPRQANPTYLSRLERRWNRQGRVGLTIDHGLGGSAGTVSGMLYVTPKYLQRSERGTFRDFTRYHVGGNATYRNTFAAGTGNRLQVLAGMDEAYQDGAILFYSLSADGGRGSTLRDNKREGANNLGTFAQLELDLGERWGLIAGARYDRVTYYSESYINPDLSGSKAFDRVTPKLGVNYRVSPLHSFYLNLGGGIEAPAGNETDPAGTFGQDTVFAINPLLDAIRSTTYEIGTKQLVIPATGGLRSVSYDLALYQTRVTNEIVPYRGGRFYFSAGKVRRTGVELGVNAETAPGFGFNGSVSWSRHRYSEYQVDSVHYGVPGRVADYSGNRVVGIPTWFYSAGVSFSPRGGKGLRFQAGLQGNSRYFADDANVVEVPGWTIANLAVGFSEPVDAGAVTLRGSIGVNNLFDRRYQASAFLNPDVVGGAPVVFEPGLPRSFVVTVAIGRR
ncbi:MAG: TonB-dependent receptor [Gemmatimonadales bacterium]